MTRDIDVPDAVFAELRKHFNERQIVELTVLIGTYNMHTRVGQALQIDPEPHHTLSSAVPDTPLLVVEDDPFLRVLQVLLDPDTPAERYAAFADFFAHEEPDFDGYCARVRARRRRPVPGPGAMVETQEEMRAALADAARRRGRGARPSAATSWPRRRSSSWCRNTAPGSPASTPPPAPSAAWPC